MTNIIFTDFLALPRAPMILSPTSLSPLSAAVEGASYRSSARKMAALLEAPPKMSLPPSILWFGEERSTELSLVGGKGASLSILQSVPGVKVPEGFIVTTEIYRQFTASNPALKQELEILDDLSDAWLTAMVVSEGNTTPEISDLETQISARAARVREKFFETAFSSALYESLMEQYKALSLLVNEADVPVAVRSSATAEDLPNASFAGQHDTFLNQKGEEQILHSVVACWASLFHPHTVQYRNQLRLLLALEKEDQDIAHGLRHSVVKLAVVIQRSLPSAVAGVGFNVNPSGEAKIHIETNYGLGETVVSGLANPDAWEVDAEAQTLLASVMGDKEMKAVAKEDGDVEYLPIPEIDRHRFSIDTERVMEIARSIRTIGEYYQKRFGYKFVDTEFAIDPQGVLYFLQTRPETVFSSSSTIAVTGIPKENAIGANMIFHGGSSGYPGARTGRLVYAKTPKEALEKIRQGDILVTSKTTPEWTIVFPKLGGIIVDVGGVLSHTAIVGREQRIPTLLATGTATKELAGWDGKTVTLDSLNSVVFEGALEIKEGKIEEFLRPELQNSGLVQDLEMQIHRIDDEGKWMSRPNMPLTAMQLDFIQKAYDEISERLELIEPLRYKVMNERIYIQIEDAAGKPAAYANLTEALLKWGLDRLEGLFDDRVDTVKQFQELADQFEPTPEMLRQFGELYRNWMVHFLSRGRFGHGAVAILMQEQMKQIPDPALLSTYLHLRFPMANLSYEKEQEHGRIGKELALLGIAKNADVEETRALLQAKHPERWQRIADFARSYEHASAEIMIAPVPYDTVLEQILMTLGDEEFEPQALTLTPQQIAKMDLLFAQNPDLARTMALAHRHLYQKENEHHIIARAQHQIQEKLLQLGQSLVDRGLLKSPDEVFTLPIEEVAKLAESVPTVAVAV
jgi:phosphohistidine swiveling domain-containing protein